MATLTNEQIEQKKQQLQQLSEQAKAIVDELTEAGAWPMSEDDLDNVAGGSGLFCNPLSRMDVGPIIP